MTLEGSSGTEAGSLDAGGGVGGRNTALGVAGNGPTGSRVETRALD